ncbi:Uncharacterised protein [uncultured archaeon]|nr:Uncharacterised protein [uncultured archaeon]
MTGRPLDIALTQVEAGSNMEELYENICTLTSEPELSFNYAATEDLRKWGFSEGCFTCLLQDKKDVFIQAIATYSDREGANNAYNANVDYLKKNDYGSPVKTRTLGESSVLFKKIQSDGFVYNFIFLKNTVHAALSGKYKKDKPDNIRHILELAEKIDRKIPQV